MSLRGDLCKLFVFVGKFSPLGRRDLLSKIPLNKLDELLIFMKDASNILPPKTLAKVADDPDLFEAWNDLRKLRPCSSPFDRETVDSRSADCNFAAALAHAFDILDAGTIKKLKLDLKGSGDLAKAMGENRELVKAWKKINDGGISDFINQPGYVKTLEKVAKYQDEAAAGSSGTVKYYRVQTEHPDSKILKVETNGNLTFNKPDVNLNLSTTTREHADYYAAQKIDQGNTVEIIEFEVPKSFDIQMKQTAVPQYKSSQNLLNPSGTAPKIVDPLQPGDPFELPGFWNQLIQQNYIPGTAKIIN